MKIHSLKTKDFNITKKRHIMKKRKVKISVPLTEIELTDMSAPTIESTEESIIEPVPEEQASTSTFTNDMIDDDSKTNTAYVNTILYPNIATENIYEGNQPPQYEESMNQRIESTTTIYAEPMITRPSILPDGVTLQQGLSIRRMLLRSYTLLEQAQRALAYARNTNRIMTILSFLEIFYVLPLRTANDIEIHIRRNQAIDTANIPQKLIPTLNYIVRAYRINFDNATEMSKLCYELMFKERPS